MTLQHRMVGYAGVCLCLAAASVSAAVIYEDDFSGSGSINLNGLAPDVGTSVWVAHSGWKADGTPGSYSSATLPFAPQSGRIYLLTARLTQVVGNGDWLALGFAAGSATTRNTNASRFVEGTTAGQPWMIRRGNAATNLDQAFIGPGTNGGSDITTLDRSKAVDFSIRLDTRQAAWSAEWMQKTTDQAVWQTVRTHTYTTPPSIAAVGLACANTGTTGKIAYFRLEEVDFNLSIVPGGHPADTVVLQEHNAVFETVFVSSETPAVSWYRQTGAEWLMLTPVPGITETSVVYDAGQNRYRASLTLLNVNAEDGGLYYCNIQIPGGYSVQSQPARLTLKRLAARWTLNASDYVAAAHRDAVAGIKLSPYAEPVFVTGAPGTQNTAIQIGVGGAGTSEPLAAVFEHGFALSLWAQTADIGALTVSNGDISLAGGAIPGGRWQHYGLVFDGQTAALYINGRPQAQQSWPLSTTYQMVLELGHAFGQTPLSGKLDDVRLYNFSLTDDEVYELYARRTGDAGCVLDYAYRFDLSGPNGWPDCRIDLHDFAEGARQWLDAQNPSAALAELVEFAQEWLTCGLDPDCL